MKKKIPIIIGIFLCFAVMISAYLWATALMDSVYAYRSPLHSTAPLPSTNIRNPSTHSLVIVLIDGLRYDTSLDTAVMPYLAELRSEGASALMHSRPPSYSENGYAVLLTGAWPELNDAPLINLDYTEIPTFTQDDIFSAAHRAGLSTAVSGFYWFEKLIPQDAVTASFYTPGEDQAADRQVTDAALPWLREGKYQLVLIHLDQVDYAGHHEGGSSDPRWNAAASRTDGLLKEIVSTMNLTQDTVLVVSDHGHLPQGGHGGQDAEILLEPFVVAGKGVVPGTYADVQMVDVAPTVAALLGTNIPATNQGHPRIEMLDISTTQVDEIKSALSSQQEQLVSVYGEAMNKTITIANKGEIVQAAQAGMTAARDDKLSSERIVRGIIGIILLILVVNIAAWYAKPYTAWILVSILTYLVFFNIKYVFIDRKTYSLSSVNSSTDLILSTAITTGLALLVSWLIVYLGTKSYTYKSLKAADVSLKFTLVSLAALSVPVISHYILNGFIVTWALPNFLLSFIGVLFLIQMIIVAALGVLLTAVASVFGIFNRRKNQAQENR